MNEQRIREIANQASDHAENTVEYFPDTEDGLVYPAKMMKIRDLKFAELIVQECLGCCEQVISDPVPESVDTWLNGGTQCMAEIKQHFGVEE